MNTELPTQAGRRTRLQSRRCAQRASATSLIDGVAKAGCTGAHDSIFEAGTELRGAPLEGNAIFENSLRHGRAVFERDEFNGSESTGGHLTEVG